MCRSGLREEKTGEENKRGRKAGNGGGNYCKSRRGFYMTLPNTDVKTFKDGGCDLVGEDS